MIIPIQIDLSEFHNSSHDEIEKKNSIMIRIPNQNEQQPIIQAVNEKVIETKHPGKTLNEDSINNDLGNYIR